MPAEPSSAPPALRVLSVEPFGRDELLAALRGVRLEGFDRPLVYAGARLTLEPATDPATLAPAQRYVLRPGLARVQALRAALLLHAVDLFALDGGAWVRTTEDPDRPVPVIPPIVEESHEPDGQTVLLVNDGIHRVQAARAAGLPISTVVVRGVPAAYPYYAYALPGGWSELVELDALPDGFEKKRYRRPDGYRALYRDFNAVFPGVQAERPDTNPPHLRA